VTRAETRVAAGALQTAADDERRILAAFRKNAGDETRRGRLAVRARHGNRIAKAHELAEHLRARDYGDTLFTRREQFRIVLPRRRSTRRRHPAPCTFVAAWPNATWRAELREMFRHIVRLQIRALHLVAEVDEHLGKMPPMPLPPMPTKWIVLIRRMRSVPTEVMPRSLRI